MAGDEYSTAGGGGGKLKLKGSKVKDSRVDKKHKKKKQPKDDKDSVTGGAEKAKESQDDNHQIAKAKTPDQLEPESEEKRVVYKTEAERRYEEQRKKKLNDRLRREGVKTHKERVEELNRYLSTLSEHHDMPKIGPG